MHTLTQKILSNLELPNIDALNRVLERLRITQVIVETKGMVNLTLDCQNNPTEQQKWIELMESECHQLQMLHPQFQYQISPNEIVLSTNQEQALVSKKSRDISENDWGIPKEHIVIPGIDKDMIVVDLNPGDGSYAQKIKQTYNCDVHVFQPGYNNPEKCDACIKALGASNVEILYLEDALAVKSERYFQFCDIAYFINYDVPFIEKDTFFENLSKVIKPNGVVYITTLQPEHLHLNSVIGRAPYLTKTAKHYFRRVEIETITNEFGQYGLMILKEPRQA